MLADSAGSGGSTIALSQLRTAGLRLDIPPPVGAQAVLAPELGRRFLIFGDAEEEFDWNRPLDRASTGTRAIAALPAATRRLNAMGVVPNYLVDYPVVATPDSAATMRTMLEAGECDIGTQLHPWVNPPFDEPVLPANSFTGNLPLPLQRAKLQALTDAIQVATGIRPTVYRAGRYGIGRDTAALLVEAGYRMDVSVRALFDYSAEQGPDFSRHPIWPWWVSDQLLELPLTAGFSGPLKRWPALYQRQWLRGPLARSRLLSRVALTPEGMPLAEVLIVIRHLLAAGTRLFSLSFHTPSVEPGHTPYVRDEADLKMFWAWWDGVFNLFAREGVLPARANDVLAAVKPPRGE